ncbi:MAG: hypothetical protein ACR2MX_07750 [Cyclobacteriaceae bacterium]
MENALQLSELHSVVTPANWKQNEDVIIDPSMPDDELQGSFPNDYK